MSQDRRLEYVPLDEIRGAESNPKKHTGDISVSIRRFTFTEPVMMDERTQRLVAGHGRIEALRQLKAGKEEPPDGIRVEGGRWMVPVIKGWASRSDTEAKAYLLASNRLTEMGGWDDKALADMLAELKASEALPGTGFDEDDLADLLKKLEAETPQLDEGGEGAEDGLEEEDSLPPVPAEPWVKLGDVFELGAHRLMCGDSVKDLAALLAGAPVAAVVTDPPYELGFMNKAWDSSGVAFNTALWKAVFGVMKPGAHLIAFGGTRTYHRMTCAIEDSGFEVRDCISWLYATGFPKSLDVSKALDSAAGAERPVVGEWNMPGRSKRSDEQKYGLSNDRGTITGPATQLAKQWAGWGTALKPSFEPAVMARKPLEGTVAANVTAHGVGGINIDACRLESKAQSFEDNRETKHNDVYGKFNPADYDGSKGRWPANTILDPGAAEQLDEQSGVSAGGKAGPADRSPSKASGAVNFLGDKAWKTGAHYGDAGGASRFFYVAKPSKAERGETNSHATVKPIALMRYLVKLVTPPGGAVLEPFSGSGTTLLACQQLGFRCFAMELSPAHVQIAVERWEKMTGEKAVKVEKTTALTG